MSSHDIYNKDQDDKYARLISLMDSVEHTNVEEEALKRKSAVLDSINQEIDSVECHAIPPTKKKKRLFISLLRVASIFLLVAVSSIVFYRGGQEGAVKKQSEVWIKVVSPRGVVADFVLPDSTKVILNGGSTMQYLSSFDKARKVKLEGEAYFDVTRNDKSRFVVLTNNIDVAVLGTKFNLKAYPKDRLTSLTLLEGSVASRTKNEREEEEVVWLVPNQQLVLNNVTKELNRNNVDAQDFMLWKDGILCFKDTPLRDIVPVLERRFNVNIDVELSQIVADKYFAQFDKDKTIDQVLELLSYKRKWKHTKEGDNYKITN